MVSVSFIGGRERWQDLPGQENLTLQETLFEAAGCRHMWE